MLTTVQKKLSARYLLLSLCLCVGHSQANPLSDAARILEQFNMQRLNEQQSLAGASIDVFRSDGCSGGLSAAWQTMAESWPEFAQAVGKAPPWEYCCTEHDRFYWQGDSVDGFEKRLQADNQLKHCVEQSAITHSAAIAQRLDLVETDVVDVFNLTAGLMFRAVRVGGGPCSGLAWRWGHGWPQCGSDTIPLDPKLKNQWVIRSENAQRVEMLNSQPAEYSTLRA